MGRAPCCEKVGLKKGRWTAEEDEKLANYIQANGEGSWRSLPKNAGLLRCGKSCRLRWINYLRADLKRGNISAEEEETIIKLHSSLGNRWSLIAAHLPGRTDNEIKNYWNSHLSRRIHSFRRSNGDGTPVIINLGRIVGMGHRRRGGRTSKLAGKKKSALEKPVDGGDHTQGGEDVAILSVNQTHSSCSGDVDLVKVIQPDSTSSPRCEPDSEPPIDFLGDEEQLGSSDLLKLLETNDELDSEFFCSDSEIVEAFRGCVSAAEERESGGWSAQSSPASDEREPWDNAVTTSCPDDEGDGEPATASSGLTEFLGDAGPADFIDTAAGQHFDDADKRECNGSEVDTWVDMELEEMTARLWEEATEESWSCQWNNELELQQFSVDEYVGALDSWLLSDIQP